MHKNIQPNELKTLIQKKADIQLVDVREKYEYEDNHISGAKLIPLGQLASRISEINIKKPVVFICRSGNRSEVASKFADKKGYDAYNLVGGMLDW